MGLQNIWEHEGLKGLSGSVGQWIDLRFPDLATLIVVATLFLKTRRHIKPHEGKGISDLLVTVPRFDFPLGLLTCRCNSSRCMGSRPAFMNVGVYTPLLLIAPYYMRRRSPRDACLSFCGRDPQTGRLLFLSPYSSSRLDCNGEYKLEESLPMSYSAVPQEFAKMLAHELSTIVRHDSLEAAVAHNNVLPYNSGNVGASGFH
jgi:hypothetical protein